jgi:hypothetical protein
MWLEKTHRGRRLWNPTLAQKAAQGWGTRHTRCRRAERALRICLFCNDRAGTKEHVWPRWLMSSVGTDRTSPTEYWNNISSPPKTWLGPTFTTKRLCGSCNNGWMSELESRVRKTMGGLINDISLVLNREQQESLALWASKTAMVIEGAKQSKNNFYSVEQRHGFRSTLVPLPDTAIWLGRCAQSNMLHGEARKLHPRKSATPNPLDDGCATTFVIGRLVIQLLSVKCKPETGQRNLIIQMREGPWERKLVQVWPIERERVNWPPSDSFNDLDDGLRDLRRRFAVGVKSGASGSE